MSSVTLQYTGPVPVWQELTVASSTGAPVAVTAAVTDTNNPRIFAAAVSGSILTVSASGSLNTLPPNVYSASVTLSAPNHANLTLPVNLLVGGAGQLTADQSPLQFSAAVGALTVPPKTLTISAGGAAIGFTAAAIPLTGGTWLSVTPASGTTPTALNVSVSASGLSAGTYTGEIRITPNTGTVLSVPVYFTVGAGGAFTFSPALLSFAYASGGQLPGAQPVTISGTSAGQVTIWVGSGSDWLRVAGETVIARTLPTTVNVSVIPTGLSTGTHTGRITVAAADGSTGYLDVTLAVNTTGVAVSPQTLAFSSAVGVTPASQSVSLSAASAGVSFQTSIFPAGSWLSASPSFGTIAASPTVAIAVNPAGLAAGTYFGYVDFSFTGGSTQRVNVTYTVGGSGGGGGAVAVAPTQLTFAARSGGTTAPPSQHLAVSGAAGSAYNAAATSTGGAWLRVSPASGTAPGDITVSVDNAIASALTAGSYQGTITVSSVTGTITIGVTLTVYSAAVLQVTPGSRALYYDPAAGTSPGPIEFYPQVSDGQQLAYTATTSTSWLQLPFGSVGTTPSPFAATLSLAGLAAGVYEGSIVVSAPGAANSPVSVPVTLVVAGEQGTIASPTSLSFTTPVGTTPASKIVTVSTGTAAFYTATTSATWIVVNPGSGITPATLDVSVASASLAAGTYEGYITISAGGLTQQVRVTLTVGSGGSATLEVENVSPAFEYQQGGAVPAARTMQVTSTGGAIGFSASASGSWLSVSPVSGTTPATLTVSLNQQALQNLAPGPYSGTVTVTGGGATITRTVTLTVRQASTLGVSPGALSYTYRTDGAVPGPQALAINSTGTALQYSATANASWLQVSPANGSTPGSLTVSVNPAGLNPGQYIGRITVATTGATPASSAGIDVTLTITAPLPTITRIVNAASFLEGPVTPGEMVTIFGTFIGPPALTTLKLDSAGRVDTTLEGVRVLFNGVPAPMIYVSAGQVSAVVPYSVAGRMTATVWLEYRGVRSNAVTAEAAAVRPAIFTANSSGSGPAAVLNQDYSFNGASNPAARGSVVTLYVTGEGQTLPNGVDGRVNDNPDDLPRPVLEVTASIGGQPARVLYAGAAPGFVSGVMQVNLEIPASAAPGDQTLTVSVGGVSSQPGVTVAVR